jgi:hypothetical protein
LLRTTILKPRCSHKDDGSGSAAQLGWHCRELTIRSGKYHSDQEAELNCPSDKSSKRAQVLIEARLFTAIDTIFRYESMLKRDLYKAISALHALQAKRIESEQEQWGQERKTCGNQPHH